jgi:PiT family inorganic phosphate transporter
MGAGYGVLDWELVFDVVAWWLVATVVAFWSSAVIGRYFYPTLVETLAIEHGERETSAKLLTLAVACYMGFSAGASNVANAIAPLVGSGIIQMNIGVLLGGVAIGIGAFVLGPRTMATVGHEITDLPIEAALVVEVLAASIITVLSWLGIPASLAITMTMCVIGLGWGRATQYTLRIQRDGGSDRTQSEESVPVLDLYDRSVSKRIVALWVITPLFAGVSAFVVFEIGISFGVL